MQDGSLTVNALLTTITLQASGQTDLHIQFQLSQQRYSPHF